MNPIRIVVTVLLMASFLLSGCGSTPAPAGLPTPTPADTPTPAAAGQHMVDLIEQGKITFRITSGAINELGLEIKNSTGEPLQVDIPAGTFFVNDDPASQNMIVRHPASVFVEANRRGDVLLEAACANIHRTEPTRDNKFTVRRAADTPDLFKLIVALNANAVDYPVEQAAVWIITDDATFDDLGMLVEGSRFGKSIINEKETLSAMMLVDKNVNAIREYAIWGDRYKFITSLDDRDLSTWLSDQLATQSVIDMTQTVLEATQKAITATQASLEETQAALANPTPEGEVISQYAVRAVASSQYSDPDWGSRQAIGEPDTVDCGDKPTAWASKAKTGKEWLVLTYELAVIPTQIVIFETYNPGAVSLVEVVDEGGNLLPVYEAAPSVVEQCPFVIVIDVKDVNVPVDKVRLTIDQTGRSGWDEIDAVQLDGILQ